MAQGIRALPPTVGRRGQGRPTSPRKTAPKPAAAKNTATAKSPPATSARTISKDELRAQVEKLERANAALRAKSREMNKAAKLSAARISELQDEVAQLRQLVTTQTGTTELPPEPGSKGVDPGNAVPPGVAPVAPDPPDQEAETAQENFEKRLGDR